MADTTDSLIKELSVILEKSRQQRAGQEQQMAVTKSEQDRQQPLNASSGFAEGFAKAQHGNSMTKSEAAHTGDDGGFGKAYQGVMDKRGQEGINADSYKDTSTSYGGDGGMNPYRIQPASAGQLSPSTTAEGRVKLGQDYARTQSLLASNPYKEQLPENPYKQAQNVPLGGPESGYGGDGPVSPYNFKNSPPASAATLSPSTTAQGRVAAAQAAMPPTYPQTSQPDYALLDAYQAFQRQRGGL